MSNKLMTHLNKQLYFHDIVILAVVFFGIAIYDSTLHFIEMLNHGQVAPETLEFDAGGNWRGIATELVALVVAWGYLKYRRFDFKQLNFSFNRWTIPKTVLYVLCASVVATLYETFQYMAFPQLYAAAEVQYGVEEHFGMWSPSLLLFALINGFYEEVFFVGLVALTAKKHLPLAIVLTLLVRFAFHTYQGLAGALTITTLGVVFLLLRRKSDELLPFTLAHSFFDLFGLTLPLYLLGE
ncbi:CPBP family intramembrane glutamic endopeptidase [Moraxella oculi]|uniref:CPBP family intramembrane glutamic endopeptidase n=1 Tax=Moraxella oculi TaxID=2940516 RepID=A0ABW8U6R5_9GAMM